MRAEDSIFLPSQHRIIHVLWIQWKQHQLLYNVWRYRAEMCPKKKTRWWFVIQL